MALLQQTYRFRLKTMLGASTLTGAATLTGGIAQATSRLRTVPNFLGGSCFAGSVSQTHATVGSITPPTSLTADKGPYIILH